MDFENKKEYELNLMQKGILFNGNRKISINKYTRRKTTNM